MNRRLLWTVASAMVPATLGCGALAPALLEHDNSFAAIAGAGFHQRLIAYGTSLSANGAWVGQVRCSLDVHYPGVVEVVNAGVSGMDSRWGLSNVRSELVPQAPDCVLIEFSINDMVNISLEESRSNTAAIVGLIQESLPGCKVFLMTMNPRSGDAQQLALQRNYYRIYHALSDSLGVGLVDINNAWLRLRNSDIARYISYIPDGCHPTPAGCEAVVTPAILSALGVPAVAR